VDIISALFAENIDLRPVPGPSTRIDLSGIMFSVPAPAAPPVSITPHLIVLVRCRPDEDGQGVLEVIFRDDKGDQVARNVSPFQVEPGKFTVWFVVSWSTTSTARSKPTAGCSRTGRRRSSRSPFCRRSETSLNL
jgi:hypothetical protein